MAQFNINESNKNRYIEVSFSDGLASIKVNKGLKLYADKLEFDEYLIFVNDHYEFEDGCYVGSEESEIIARTGGVHSWIHESKFYIKVLDLRVL